MARRTLIDFFEDLSRISGEFLAYDDGYRTWSVHLPRTPPGARAAFAARLHAAGIAKGQHVVIWSENRPEWIIALWGCLLQGVVLVPIDYRASAEFLQKVAGIVDAKRDSRRRHGPHCVDELKRRRRPELRARTGRAGLAAVGARQHRRRGTAPAVELTPDDVAEVIFTSGATSEPKGVVLTHRNILANIVPIEREIAKYRRVRQAVPADPVPESPAAQPHVRTGDGHVRAAAARRRRGLHADVRARRNRHADPHAGACPCWCRCRRSSRCCAITWCATCRRPRSPRRPDALDGAVVALPAGPPAVRAEVLGHGRRRRAARSRARSVLGPARLRRRPGLRADRNGADRDAEPSLPRRRGARSANRSAASRCGSPTTARSSCAARTSRPATSTRPKRPATAFRDGWFHTGDIGELDDQGRLHIRGRKKEMIVTPEGLNVFPEDVERALNDQPGVRESAVVGAPVPGGSAERVQAVVVLAAGADLDAIVRGGQREAAGSPEDPDWRPRGRSASFPAPRARRSSSAGSCASGCSISNGAWRRLGAGATSGGPSSTRAARSVTAVLERFAPGRTDHVDNDDRRARSELARARRADDGARRSAAGHGRRSQVRGGEDRRRSRGADAPARRARERTRTVATARRAEPIDFPSWNRSAPARALRRASLPTWILPLARVFASVRVEGLEHSTELAGRRSSPPTIRAISTRRSS